MAYALPLSTTITHGLLLSIISSISQRHILCSVPHTAHQPNQIVPIQKFQSPFPRFALTMAEPHNPVDGDHPEDSYSVWALPPANFKDRLKSLMSSLRSDFGGPVFDPHITVVGDLRLRRDDAIARFHSAVATLQPYTVRIAGVAYGTFFYQCIYLLIDPSPEVVETSSHCCGHFGYKRSTPYMPHVSLVYGDLSDEEKEKARKRAEEIDGSIFGLTLEISSLALCKTDTQDKTTESWEMVELCDLKKKDFA